MNLDIIKVYFIYKLMHKRISLKRVLKFTLKQLQHVSVWSPSSGSLYRLSVPVKGCTLPLPFLTSLLDEGEWSASVPGRFIPGKEHFTLFIRRSLGLRVSLGVLQKWKFLIYQLMHKRNALKGVLKFTLKHLQHLNILLTVHLSNNQLQVPT